VKRYADPIPVGAIDPDPDREYEKQRDERLCNPGSQNYQDQLSAELDACEHYWSDTDISDYRVIEP
jgi:hypothetical protein